MNLWSICVILNKENDECSSPTPYSNPRPQLHIAVWKFNNMYGLINVLWIKQHAQSTQAHKGAMILPSRTDSHKSDARDFIVTASNWELIGWLKGGER
jgi:hypothetical protein